MWEKLVNCIKGNGGAQKTSCQVVQLADLMKQVPPNQLKMFQMFAKKHEEYKLLQRTFQLFAHFEFVQYLVGEIHFYFRLTAAAE